MSKGAQILLKELIEIGANLHSISYRFGGTPLTDLIRTLFYRICVLCEYSGSIEVATNDVLPDVLSLWLEWLQESGVDLEQYGRKESELHQEGIVSWTFRRAAGPRQEDPVSGTFYYPWVHVICTIQSLVYGPLPSDWKLEVEIIKDPTAENLRRMPEGWTEDNYLNNPEQNTVGSAQTMPGGWIEDDDLKQEQDPEAADDH